MLIFLHVNILTPQATGIPGSPLGSARYYC